MVRTSFVLDRYVAANCPMLSCRLLATPSSGEQSGAGEVEALMNAGESLKRNFPPR